MIRVLSNNWKLKVTAFVLAVALWSHVRGEVNPWETLTVRVPLVASPPPNMIMTEQTELPATVLVTLQGPRSSLRDFRSTTPGNPLAGQNNVPLISNGLMRAVVNFKDARKGRQQLAVSIVPSPRDAEVIGTKPSSVEVTMDRAESLKLMVRAKLPSPTVSGYELVEARVQPAEVTAFGPSSLLSRIKVVEALVSARNFKAGENHLQNVPLVPVDSEGDLVAGVRMEPDQVRLSATMRDSMETRSVQVDVVVTGRPAQGNSYGRVVVTPSALQVRGYRRVLSRIKSLTVRISVEGRTNTFTRHIAVPAPRNTQIVGDPRVLLEVPVFVNKVQHAITPLPGVTPTRGQTTDDTPVRQFSP